MSTVVCSEVDSWNFNLEQHAGAASVYLCLFLE